VEWQAACQKAEVEGRPLPRPDQVRTYECPCEDQYVLARYLSYWGVQDRFQRSSWRDLVSDDVVKIYRECAENLTYYIRTGAGLYLQGGNGIGKSLLCGLIAKEAVRTGHVVRFSTFVDLLSWHESTYKGSETDDAKKFFRDEVQDVDLLVIDDLGKENLVDKAPSPMVVQKFISELLRQRDQRGKSTFVSANLFAHKIEERYGMDVGSLVEGNFEVITIDGQDFRERLQARRKAELGLKLVRPVLI
jgi:DNA replication protein DnaC